MIINYIVNTFYHRRGVKHVNLLQVFCYINCMTGCCLFCVWDLKYKGVGIWPWGLSHHGHNPFQKSLRFLFPKCLGNMFMSSAIMMMFLNCGNMSAGMWAETTNLNHVGHSAFRRGTALLLLSWIGFELCHLEVKKLLLIPRAPDTLQTSIYLYSSYFPVFLL